jgi:LPXTG-motif cell wall-anchored protein
MGIKLNKIFFLIPILFLILHFPSVVYAGAIPDGTYSSLTPIPAELPADGHTSSTITVILRDSSQTLLTDGTFEISSTNLTLNVTPSLPVPVDGSGTTVLTVTSTTPGVGNIDLTYTATDTTVTTLPALGSITFDAVPTPTDTITPTPTDTITPTPTDTPTPTPAPSSSSSDNGSGNSSGSVSCGNAYPTDAPNLYSVITVNESATLYFAPPSSPFDGFTISYGLDTNAEAYTVSFNQGVSSGAITYTVNNLSPHTTYYYKVRANNGCAPGPWSSVVSSSKTTVLPVTGSSGIITLGLAGLVLCLAGLGYRIKHNQ